MTKPRVVLVPTYDWLDGEKFLDQSQREVKRSLLNTEILALLYS